MATFYYVITLTLKGREPFAVQKHFESVAEADRYAAEHGLGEYTVIRVEAI